MIPERAVVVLLPVGAGRHGEAGDQLEQIGPPVEPRGDGPFPLRLQEVVEVEPAKRVVWAPQVEPPEWLGTTITFDLSEEDGYVIVTFAHAGWTEVGAFMHHCSTKWAVYLLSLKQLVETGTGDPSPDDLQISNWH